MLSQTVVTLPFAVTSILFLQSLSPMVIYVRSEYDDIAVARKKALQIMNRAFFLLAGVVFFFAFSCTMSISHQEAYNAFVANTSFLAVIVEVIPGDLVSTLGVIIDICAVTTSFFGVLLGWGATIVNYPILYFTSICSPIFAVIGCFIPVILTYKADALAKYRGFQAWLVVLTGMLLVLSPFLALLET